MSTFADLTGVMVTAMRLVVPWSGRWHADVSLIGTTDVSGMQTLNFIGVPWSCAYVRAVDFAGQRGVRVVAGRGGWSQSIPAKQYGQGTITTQTVCADAAVACGEVAPVIDASVPSTVGSAFCRQAGAASLVLQQVLGDAWWTDTTGTVQTKPRTSQVTSPFIATQVVGAEGWYEIATESPSDWMPGASFSGPTVSGTVSRLTHVIGRDTLRTEVLVV